MTAWVSAGFPPDSFWQQTPDSFGAIMDGARKRIRSEAEGALMTVHSGAIFNALASNGKLADFDKYMRKDTAAKPTPQSLDEVMGKWAALASAGYPIKIEGAA